MRTSFHHQPEAQHPNFPLSTSRQADYPIFRSKADIATGSRPCRRDAKRTWEGGGENVEERRMPSRPGEFHPEPLTEPDVSLSTYPARATARRLPPSTEHRVPPVAG